MNCEIIKLQHLNIENLINHVSMFKCFNLPIAKGIYGFN
jgi:hypothetical protein